MSWLKNKLKRQPHLNKKLFALSICLISFAVTYPPMTGKSSKDPMTNSYTDHLRYWYCVSLLWEHGLEIYEKPLGQIAKGNHAATKSISFDYDPCVAGGVLWIAVHAPFQLAVDHGYLTLAQSRLIYATILHIASHLTLFFIIGYLQLPLWAFFFWPILIIISYRTVQTPLPLLTGMLSMYCLGQKRFLRAFVLATFSMSFYIRWIVLMPAVTIGLFSKSKHFLSSWKTESHRWAQVALIGALLSLILFSIYVFWAGMVYRQGHPQHSMKGVYIALSVLFAGWAYMGLKNRSSLFLSLNGCSFICFLFYNIGKTIHIWYFGPFFALVPLLKTRNQIIWWFTSLVFFDNIYSAQLLKGLRMLAPLLTSYYS